VLLFSFVSSIFDVLFHFFTHLLFFSIMFFTLYVFVYHVIYPGDFLCSFEKNIFYCFYMKHYLLLLLLSRFSRVRLCATPQMAAHQASPSLGFSRQEHWSGLPFPFSLQSVPIVRENPEFHLRYVKFAKPVRYHDS